MPTSPTCPWRPDLDPPRHPNRSLDPPHGSAASMLVERVRILIVLVLAAGLITGPAPTAAAAPTVTRPGAPASVSAEAGDGRVTVSWQPPTTGGPVESYR